MYINTMEFPTLSNRIHKQNPTYFEGRKKGSVPIINTHPASDIWERTHNEIINPMLPHYGLLFPLEPLFITTLQTG